MRPSPKRPTSFSSPEILSTTRGWGSLEPLTKALSRLDAPLGVWAVWGNHDYHNYFFGLDRVRESLEGTGVRVLTNEGVQAYGTTSSWPVWTTSGMDNRIWGQPFRQGQRVQRRC